MRLRPNLSIPAQARPSAHGFTLIEVIVALSVFAVGLAGVAAYTKQALSDNSLSNAIQEASHFADRHLSEIQLDHSVGEGVYLGSYQRPDGGSIYDWRLMVETLELAPLEEELVEFTTKVKPLKVSLRVEIEEFKRELNFHVLVLAPPLQTDLPEEMQ